MLNEAGVSADLLPDHQSRLRSVHTFWEALEVTVDKEAGTRDGVLDGLRAEVMDLLRVVGVIALNQVETLTAQAAMHLTGKRSF